VADPEDHGVFRKVGDEMKLLMSRLPERLALQGLSEATALPLKVRAAFYTPPMATAAGGGRRRRPPP